MVWMSRADFEKEHKHLIPVLTSGTASERKAEAEDQSQELEDEMAKQDIKEIIIEPADNGGFMVKVERPPKPSKPVIDSSNSVTTAPSTDYDDRFEKLSFANIKQVMDHLSECFPAPTSTTHKGKEKTSEAGGSRMDTYESGEAGEE